MLCIIGYVLLIMYFLGRVYIIIVALSLCVSCKFKGSGTGGDKTAEIKGDIIIFHAGSLSVPFREISREFEQANPGTRVMLEAAGSVASARKITDLHKACDIMASADHRIISELLIPGHAKWQIAFAANEMVIAFNERSRQSENINEMNWMDILSHQEVRFGRSDPDSDPCGYRTLMVLQLAGEFYAHPGLTEALSSKDKKYIRPKEVDLLALLEIGEIDYIFIYRSVAVQHKLKFIELPAEINLSDPALNEDYSKAVVSIVGTQPGSRISLNGEAMVYGVTLLESAPNPIVAMAFMEYLLDAEKGMKIMEAGGQSSVIPSGNEHYDHLPSNLKKYASPIIIENNPSTL